jgi:hypothetical protein
MSDCIDDYSATVKLIIYEYADLKKINSKHELLGLLKKVNSEGFTMTKEFARKYAHYGKTHKTPVGKASAVLRAYYHDINTEATEGLIGLLLEQKEKTEEELWKIMEERGLTGTVKTHLTHNTISLKDFLKSKD